MSSAQWRLGADEREDRGGGGHSEDFGALRPVATEGGGFVFGAADPDAVDDAPRLMDVTTPAGVEQTDVLAYEAGSRATVPFVSLD